MYPDWGKMRFKDFEAQPWQDLLPGASDAGIDFIKRTVCYESTHRLTAEEVRYHWKLTRVAILTSCRRWSIPWPSISSHSEGSHSTKTIVILQERGWLAGERKRVAFRQ